MNDNDYFTLIETAHGCEMPASVSTFREWAGEIIYYDVYLPLYRVNITVPMHDKAVLLHLAQLHTRFTPQLPWEHVEAYVQNYKVRPIEAISYALSSFHAQPEDVRNYLIGRFGPHLEQAREQGHQWWTETFVR